MKPRRALHTRLTLALLLAPASLLVTGAARAQVAAPPPAPGEVTLHVAAPSPPAAPLPAEPPPQPRHCGGARASAGVVLVPGQLPGGYVRAGGDLFSRCATAPVATKA